VVPLGQISLPVIFGDVSKYRIETLNLCLPQAQGNGAYQHHHYGGQGGHWTVVRITLSWLRSIAELKEWCLSAASDFFKGAEDAKAIQIDAEDLTKTIQIGASKNPK
jgi:hypothetical protein